MIGLVDKDINSGIVTISLVLDARGKTEHVKFDTEDIKSSI